ncbi:MAG TPA: class I SAM-dependent methyltransferase [Candidatus Udaeobacter sp.]|jgi:SAM-dependent methyltransferase|nr:class I SAM-dependent methyltransferase [Candidatus Udaeobacter sp.]
MAARVSGWDQARRSPTGRWSVWKFNWLANHKIIRALERARPRAHGVLLDVGCGSKPFARIFEGRVSRYLGTDLSASRYLGEARLDAFARAEAMPFRSGSIDTILGLSMLTYLPEPLRMLEEAERALKPDGILMLEFTQMAPLHDAPHDYFRFTRYGAEWLLERAGFEPIEFIPIGGLMARVGLSAIAALNRINRGPTRVLTEIPVRVLYIVLQVLFEVLDELFFDPREVLAHLVVARKRR